MNENHIKNLRISNFKSLKDVEMDCSRINLIVGKPNVGKSNILEALSLFCAPFSRAGKFLSEFIRYNEASDLFYDFDLNNEIEIKTDFGWANLFYSFEDTNYRLIIGPDGTNLDKINKNSTHEIENLNRQLNQKIPLTTCSFIDNGNKHDAIRFFHGPIKKYNFRVPDFGKNGDKSFLKPPFGENLFSIILTRSDFKNEVSELFEQYSLKLALDPRNKAIEIQKNVGNFAYRISYNLIADTLQRIIFHYAAIYSNKDSILLFEEPEAHSHPPYIWELSHKIIDSTSNQFFISTHNPYLFNTIVENTPDEELAIFVADFKNFETKIKRLNEEEMSDLLKYHIDIFGNVKRFLDE